MQDLPRSTIARGACRFSGGVRQARPKNAGSDLIETRAGAALRWLRRPLSKWHRVERHLDGGAQ
jgi:hypothetical protein